MLPLQALLGLVRRACCCFGIQEFLPLGVPLHCVGDQGLEQVEEQPMAGQAGQDAGDAQLVPAEGNEVGCSSGRGRV